MPTYTVRDPNSGKTLTLRGDSPPTEQELNDIFDKVSPKTDWKQTIGSAVKSSFQKPAAFAKDLGTNPQTMANAMPTLLGTAGGMSPIPGGATGGTLLGQGLRAGADKLMGKPVPGLMQHGLELGGAALGDVMAIPAMKAKYYGGQIGEAESKFPGMADVIKEAPPSGPRPAVKFAQQLKGQDLSPLEAKRFQPAMKTVYDKGIPFQKPYKMYAPDFMEANRAITKGLNKIPGRQVASDAMAKAMTIPNAIRDARQAIWQNPILRRLIYAAVTGAGLGEGAKLTFGK